MSVSLILVPAAMAAVAAWKASRPETDAHGRTVCHVATRMRNEHLLAAALADTGASTALHESRLSAEWQGVQADFRRDADGAWSVHLVGEVDTARAEQIIAAVDAAYGRRVQQEVLAKLRERAPRAGMTLESETVENDDSVTVVLTVGASA